MTCNLSEIAEILNVHIRNYKNNKWRSQTLNYSNNDKLLTTNYFLNTNAHKLQNVLCYMLRADIPQATQTMTNFRDFF